MALIQITADNIGLWSKPAAALYEQAADGALSDMNVAALIGEPGLAQRLLHELLAEATGCAKPERVPLSFFASGTRERLVAYASAGIGEESRRYIRIHNDLPEPQPALVKSVLFTLEDQFVCFESHHAFRRGIDSMFTSVHLRPMTRKETHEALKKEGRYAAKFDKQVREAIYEVTGGVQERVIDCIGLAAQRTKGDIMDIMQGEDRFDVKALYDTVTAADKPFEAVCDDIKAAFEKLTWRPISRHLPDMIANDVLSNMSSLYSMGLHDLLTLKWDTKQDTLHSCITLAARVRKTS